MNKSNWISSLASFIMTFGVVFLWTRTKLIRIVVVAFVCLSLLSLSNVSIATPQGSPNKNTIYDERLKILEDRTSLLGQKQDDIKQTESQELSMLLSVSEASKHAIDAANDAAKRMESFYTAAGTGLSILIGAATIILTVLGIIGGFFGIREFKKAAKTLLDQEIENFNGRVKNIEEDYVLISRETATITKDTANISKQLESKVLEVEALKEELKTIKNDATATSEALTYVSAAGVLVSNAVAHLQTANDDMKMKLKVSLTSAIVDTTKVIDQQMTEDKKIMSWAHTIRGTARFINDEFEAALNDFECSIQINPDRAPTLYNAACCACKLGFESKALDLIKQAIKLDPGRLAEAKKDSDLKPILTDLEKM